MHFHHENRGTHPMVTVGFLLILAGFAAGAGWLVSMASGNAGPAVALAALSIACFAGGAVIMATLVRKTHHSPFQPDVTLTGRKRYFSKFR